MINQANPDFSNIPTAARKNRFSYIPKKTNVKPVISIVTPFFNGTSEFDETVESVFGQSLQQWEWIIVNDGSTQKDSLIILDKFRNIDPRIKIIDLPKNKGLPSARNMGYGHAATEFVLQLDADDLLEPTAAEKWYWFLISYPNFSFVKGLNIGFGAKEYLWENGFHNEEQMLSKNLVNPTALVRKKTHESAGGYDESMTGGLEDWDFWLRCASKGYWGGTIFEYLDWYRTRESHDDKWENFTDTGIAVFKDSAKEKYPEIYNGEFPVKRPHYPGDFVSIKQEYSIKNLLIKEKRRLLMVLPWMRVGGADQFNLNLIKMLVASGWEVSIITTLGQDNEWESEFYNLTPDIFVLPKFIQLVDFPRFIGYFIGSRNPDVVLISNSEIGYFSLPYLREQYPNTVIVDYNHMEEPSWKSGSHPRTGVEYQDGLDMNIVASNHLKEWMKKKGADESKIETCYINVDTKLFTSDKDTRIIVRNELGILNNVPVMAFVGRLVDQKQPIVLIKTIEKLYKSGTLFHALIIGDGPELAWIKSYSIQHGFSEVVTFTNSIPNNSVKELLQASDVLFLPSKWEGIALTIYEAMACEVGVVGADVGGQKELVTEECGILVDIRNMSINQQITRYDEALSSLFQNPKKIEGFRRNSRKRVVEHFDLKIMGENMERLFDKALLAKANTNDPDIVRSYINANLNLALEYSRIVLHADQTYRTGTLDHLIEISSWKLILFFLLKKIFLSSEEKFLSKFTQYPVLKKKFKAWVGL